MPWLRRTLSCLAVLVLASGASAVPVVDQAHEITQSVGGRLISAGSSPAQTFTAGTSGLLSQVDVLLSREAGDIGDLSLEVWPVVAEGPAGSTPLLTAPIDTGLVAVGTPSYVDVDVAAGGLLLSPGVQYAITVSGTALRGSPRAAWQQGRPGYEFGEQFARSGSWRLDGGDFDYGFRTWVDPTGTGGLNEVSLPLLVDAEAQLFESIGVTEYGGTSIRVDADTPDGADSRGLFTFDASGLAPDAQIESATFVFDKSSFTSGSAGNPSVELYGFAANGLPTAGEASDLSRPLGGTGDITDLGLESVPLNVATVRSLLSESDEIGVTAVQTGAPQWLTVVSSELAAQSNFFKAAELRLGLAEAPTPARVPDGDYNRDAYVDAADYTVWRDTAGDAPGYQDWAANYGTMPDEEVANGDFVSGDLTGWEVTIEENTNVSFGFPRVESFDVDGDGQADEAFRVRLGRSDTSEFGGTVAIEQEILLEGGDYTFTADVASQSLETLGGNTGPGNFELIIDGVIVDQVLQDGTSIAAGEVLRNTLEATISDLQPGYHTLRLTVNRGATNSRQIYQFIDNITFTPAGAATAVPEPTALMLIGLLAATGAVRRRG